SFIQSSFILEEAVNPESAKDSVRYPVPSDGVCLTASQGPSQKSHVLAFSRRRARAASARPL
ncbi:hypothetical protein, partial [Bradyrhizobium diazoefficiens]|uniref:hypothetical protein n=1 Tax=Bradyrhizobium diazoefficiens TaxID=1355477 RepID=UPI001B8BA7D0